MAKRQVSNLNDLIFLAIEQYLNGNGIPTKYFRKEKRLEIKQWLFRCDITIDIHRRMIYIGFEQNVIPVAMPANVDMSDPKCDPHTTVENVKKIFSEFIGVVDKFSEMKNFRTYLLYDLSGWDNDKIVDHPSKMEFPLDTDDIKAKNPMYKIMEIHEYRVDIVAAVSIADLQIAYDIESCTATHYVDISDKIPPSVALVRQIVNLCSMPYKALGYPSFKKFAPAVNEWVNNRKFIPIQSNEEFRKKCWDNDEDD